MTVEKESSPSEDTTSQIASAIEKLVEAKYLILLLSFFLYLDIWLLHYGVDLTAIKVSEVSSRLSSVAALTGILFLISYSLLMAVFFPAVRVIFSGFLVNVFGMDYHLKRSFDTKRLSDWAMSLVAFSTWSGVVGASSRHLNYRGLVVFIVELAQTPNIVTVLFVLCAFALWGVCACLACQADL